MNPRWLCTAMLVACGNTPEPPAIDAPTSAWSTGPAIPVPRLESGVTALGQSVVVVGGFDTDQQAGLDVTKRVDVLDTFEQTWSQLPDAPVARHHVQVAVIGTTLYLLGGLDGAADASLTFPARGDCYAIDTGDANPQWRQIASMAPGDERGSAAVVVAAPRIYLFGGASTTDALATNIFYDTVVDGWCPGAACAPKAELPPLPAPRSHPAALRRGDGTFAVVGGLAGLASDTAEADVYVLPTDQQQAGGTWTAGLAMPVQRGGCAFGMIGGKLICAGGEAGTSALTYTQGYDPIENTWTDFELMPMATAGTLGAAIGQRLYVPGGARQLIFEPTDTLYIFSPLDTAGPHAL
jgi:N-acetylneuraminic acid mutarotase